MEERNDESKRKEIGANHNTNFELAHLVSIIKLSEDDSINANFANAEEEDTMEYSNLHKSSFLDHDEPNYHESITDIANSLQVEITEERTLKNQSLRLGNLKKASLLKTMAWFENMIILSMAYRSSILDSPFLLTTPF